MPARELLEPTPWDTALYGMPTYELRDISEEALRKAAAQEGHYTVKVDPLAPKGLLHALGFYYCDTLLEPVCARGDLVAFDREGVAVAMAREPEALLAICHGAFRFDRFHRDFRLDPALADLRYDNWLRQLARAGNLYGVQLEGKPAAFIGLDVNRMVLHAVAQELRGRGLAKYLWTAACRHFFDALGHETLESSVSAANLPVLNLYASLGFRLHRAVDVYHLTVPATRLAEHAS